ncbi:MAG: cytochrome c oxidase assembly protein [Candidatus Limnocylindrales bacterium]
MRPIWRATLAGPAVAMLATLTSVSVAAHGTAGPEPTALGVVTIWLPDPLPWMTAIVAAAGYLLAVRRVNAAHPRTPVPAWRIIAWLAGVAIGLVALVSAIDVYADDLLTVHMVQHLLLTMISPPLLALGAPVTLILRLASPGLRRKVLVPLLHSALMRVTSYPAVGWLTLAAVMWLTHFSPLYDAALADPTLHVAEHLLLVASAILFWWPAVAADPAPHRLGYLGRLVYLVLTMPVAAAVGLAIYFAPTVLYPHYATLERTWGPNPLVDQELGGLLMWGVGDLVMLGAIALLVSQWMRADVRRSRMLDARRASAMTRV